MAHRLRKAYPEKEKKEDKADFKRLSVIGRDGDRPLS